MTQIPSTLFICYGNVCRSQMAQGWFNHFTQSSQGTSAGTNPMAAHLFRQPAPETIQVMKEEGIDISDQPVTTITPEMAAAADRVVVLCQLDECPRFVLDHQGLLHRPVEDPWAKNIAEFRSVREQIRLIVQDLLPDDLPTHFS